MNDGANDGVLWSPTVTYSAIDGVSDINTVVTDVNGLSQTNYVASDDFVLSGRPDTLVFMPFTGTVRFSATINKLKVTSDDVKVVLQHNGQPVTVANAVFNAAFQGSRTVTADFAVAAPVQPTDPNVLGSQDSVTVKFVTDTPIDLGPGDAFLLYTDGILRSGKDERRGPAPGRLEKILRHSAPSAEALLKHVLAQTAPENSAKTAPDDVAAIAVRREDRQ